MTGRQPARAHLHRLLRDIVEPGVLERREEIVDVGRVFLRPGSLADLERRAFSGDGADRSGVFAVAPVEGQHARARAEPQHVDEIIGLVERKRRGRAFAEVAAEIKAGRGEIGAGHREGLMQAACSAPPIAWPRGLEARARVTNLAFGAKQGKLAPPRGASSQQEDRMRSSHPSRAPALPTLALGIGLAGLAAAPAGAADAKHPDRDRTLPEPGMLVLSARERQPDRIRRARRRARAQFRRRLLGSPGLEGHFRQAGVHREAMGLRPRDAAWGRLYASDRRQWARRRRRRGGRRNARTDAASRPRRGRPGR